MNQVYRCKNNALPGTSYKELVKFARHEYHIIQNKTPRRIPYIRSAYFTKDKIFINNFWDHLNQKNARDRVRRLKLYICAIELIRNSKIAPTTMQNPNNNDETLHRFDGITANGLLFSVQIKENKKTNRKEFISCFPNK
jgi:hypothetical protein